MSGLSEVSVLIAQRARDIEKAREIFTAEIRGFASSILGSVRVLRTEPWTRARVRVDLPREIETEAKMSSEFSNQFAITRASLKFKKGTNFRHIADVRAGIEFDDDTGVFAWQLNLVPSSSYNRIDDEIWHRWKAHPSGGSPGARHFDKANTVRFLSRPVGPELTGEIAFNDTKTVLEFLLTPESEAGLAEAVGLEDE